MTNHRKIHLTELKLPYFSVLCFPIIPDEIKMKTETAKKIKKKTKKKKRGNRRKENGHLHRTEQTNLTPNIQKKNVTKGKSKAD
jgi:hypothetical protein